MAATGYTVSPGSASGPMGIASQVYTVTAEGGVFNPSGDGEQITVTLNGPNDVLAATGATIVSVSGNQAMIAYLLQPNNGVSSFSFTFTPNMPGGGRLISFANNSGWADAPPFPFGLLPVSEQITQAIAFLLQSVRTVAIDGVSPQALNVKRCSTRPTPQTDATCLVIPTDAVPDEEGDKVGSRSQFSYWMKRYYLMVYCRLGDNPNNAATSPQPLDRVIEQRAADVLYSLGNDPRLSRAMTSVNLPAKILQDVRFMGNDLFVQAEGQDLAPGVALTVEYPYFTLKRNPYLQA
jgi:hypothetical protein